jgi:hypothetical protein
MNEFKVITEGSPNELWASGFYNEAGRVKAQSMVNEHYWHMFMFPCDQNKTLVVVPVKS